VKRQPGKPEAVELEDESSGAPVCNVQRRHAAEDTAETRVTWNLFLFRGGLPGRSAQTCANLTAAMYRST